MKISPSHIESASQVESLESRIAPAGLGSGSQDPVSTLHFQTYALIAFSIAGLGWPEDVVGAKLKRG